jgi:NADH:ubiquinone oxidoreductase subunit 4 (subunit M)
LLFGYQDCLSLVGKNFLQISILISSVNDFMLETGFQDASAEFFYILQENQLDYKNFVSFKDNLLEASYYENSDKFLTETVHFKGESTNLFRIYNNIEGHFCSNNTNSLLQCCYFSDCVFTVLNFTEFLQSHDSVFNIVPLEADLRLIFNLKIYMFSVINIVNFNCLFLEQSEQIVTYESIFDFSFVVLGMLVIILALFFKLALAPFHLWVPDVYEGSPSSSTFFFMVISKISIFVFLLRMCYSSFYSLISYWQFYSLIVGTFSVFIGAVVGLKQRKLKSLLTYSSINNTGFILLAFSVGSFEGIQTQFYYLITYMLASIGIWGTLLSLKLKKKTYFEKQNKDLGDLALLQECNGIMAQNLGLMLFSLAGLPPTIGFLAKMGVFKALTSVSMYFFVVINILFSVIATFYYLRITKIIFFENTLVGNLYKTINSKKIFLINILSFALLGLFISPMFLYLASYKITLFLNKTFY